MSNTARTTISRLSDIGRSGERRGQGEAAGVLAAQEATALSFQRELEVLQEYGSRRTRAHAIFSEEDLRLYLGG